MKYTSTRDNTIHINASEAILQGLSKDGGLFVPEHMPVMDCSLEDMAKMNYKEVAYEVMKLFIDDFTEEELKSCIEKAYDDKFDTEEIAPIKELKDEVILELWHGKTIAFKDMALSILPHLMVTSAKKNNTKNEIVILAATSGDTGKAALAGFANVPGTRIIVFYPKNGVSAIQEKQMLTQEGDNTCVVAIHGNFDDAQTGVKNIFNDRKFAAKLDEKGFQFSSANSINIGRLVPQIVYYFYAYTRLLGQGRIDPGEKVNFDVPTGNFGNILAAYYAKLLGLPVNKLICASNENKVLFDFFRTGTYDRNREFILTNSPSMDILISSNLERLIFRLTDNNAEETVRLMGALKSEGKYTITDAMREKITDFYGNYASEEEDKEVIRRIFDKEKYVLDTHTAVAVSVYEKYKSETGDETLTVVDSTASPYKFTKSVMEAITGHSEDDRDPFELVDELNRLSGMYIPKAIEEIRTAPILHTKECDADKMKKCVEDILGL